MSQWYDVVLKIAHDSCFSLVGPSGTKRPLTPPTRARRVIYSSDEEDDAPPRAVWPPLLQAPVHQIGPEDYEDEQPQASPTASPVKKKAKRRACPFIDAEAGVSDDDESSDDEDEPNNDVNLEDFIVGDDCFD